MKKYFRSLLVALLGLSLVANCISQTASRHQKVINGTPIEATAQLGDITQLQGNSQKLGFSCGRKSCSCKGSVDCVDMFTSGPCGTTISGACIGSKCTCTRPKLQE